MILYGGFTGAHYNAQLIPEQSNDTLIPLKPQYTHEIQNIEVRITNVDNELLTFSGSSINKDNEIYINLAIVSIRD